MLLCIVFSDNRQHQGLSPTDILISDANQCQLARNEEAVAFVAFNLDKGS